MQHVSVSDDEYYRFSRETNQQLGYLNDDQFYFDEPNSFARDIDRYRNATPGGVQRWARGVGRGKPDLRQTLTRAEFLPGGTIGVATG